jgi:hypothetical protein
MIEYVDSLFEKFDDGLESIKKDKLRREKRLKRLNDEPLYKLNDFIDDVLLIIDIYERDEIKYENEEEKNKYFIIRVLSRKNYKEYNIKIYNDRDGDNFRIFFKGMFVFNLEELNETYDILKNKIKKSFKGYFVEYDKDKFIKYNIYYDFNN